MLIEDEPASAVTVFGERIELARRYAAALSSDGVLRGVVGPREAGRMWSRHILNSAVVGELVSAGSSIVDVGSGAGLPGIPLAMARPDCRFVLIEPLERRTAFLEEMIVVLGLENCRVVRGRADQVVKECGGADVVTSRAVAPLAQLSAWSAPLLRVGGELLAIKGSTAWEEIVRDQDAVRLAGIVDLTVVNVGAALVEPETVVIRGRRTGGGLADKGTGVIPPTIRRAKGRGRAR